MVAGWSAAASHFHVS